MYGFEAKDILSYLAMGLIGIALFVFRQAQAKAKDHDHHLSKLDEAIHRLEMQQVEHRRSLADIKEFRNDIKELEQRMKHVETMLTRIDERLSGKRRTDQDRYPHD